MRKGVVVKPMVTSDINRRCQVDCIDMPSNSRWRKSLYHGVLCIVLETHPCGHLWKLGCKSGVLDQWYSQNQFQPTLEKFMNMDDVPMDKEISLRAAARLESIGGGQGIFKCNCTGTVVNAIKLA